MNATEQREADVRAFHSATGVWPVVVVTDEGEMLYAPEAVPAQFQPLPEDPEEVAAVAAFETEQLAKKERDYADFKARDGEPEYLASLLKIAADKLGLTIDIEAAIGRIVAASGEKAVLIWWGEAPAISRGDAQWKAIEAEAGWKDGSADGLFDFVSGLV